MKTILKNIGLILAVFIMAAAFLITAVIDLFIWIEEFYIKTRGSKKV